MDRLGAKLSETEPLIKRARTAFTVLYQNQEELEKMLRSIGDRQNLMFVRRNKRLLQAINGSMERFTLLTHEADATRAKEESGHLAEDLLSVQPQDRAEAPDAES